MPDQTTFSAPDKLQDTLSQKHSASCKVAVIWIDWYAYHVGRFRGILSIPSLSGHACGIELVGGVGVHAGLTFREHLHADLTVETVMPKSNWHDVGKTKLSLELWRILTQLHPKVVLVPGYYTLPGIAAAVWAKMHGARSVLMTESTLFDHERQWWKEAVKGFVIRTLFDWAVTGGKAHVHYLKQLGFDETRIAHFYDVVDNRSYRKQTDALRFETREMFELPERYFLYVGRLAPEKNIAGLIRSWIVYRREGGNWPLLLVGDGPLAQSLKKQASECEYADEIHFAGHKRSSELPPYYAFAGCFVLPSTREPWGLVVNEAMASGLPVIVSTSCGCAEDLLIEGMNGFLFDPLEEPALTRCLTQMSELEESAREQMGLSSMRIIDRYSPESFGREIARIVDA